MWRRRPPTTRDHDDGEVVSQRPVEEVFQCAKQSGEVLIAASSPLVDRVSGGTVPFLFSDGSATPSAFYLASVKALQKEFDAVHAKIEAVREELGLFQEPAVFVDDGGFRRTVLSPLMITQLMERIHEYEMDVSRMEEAEKARQTQLANFKGYSVWETTNERKREELKLVKERNVPKEDLKEILLQLEELKQNLGQLKQNLDQLKLGNMLKQNLDQLKQNLEQLHLDLLDDDIVPEDEAGVVEGEPGRLEMASAVYAVTK